MDRDDLLRRHLAAPTPVTDGAFAHLQPLSELRDAPGEPDGSVKVFHNPQSAPTVHINASHFIHRHGGTIGARSPAMDILIMPDSAYRKAVGLRLRQAIDALDLSYAQAAIIMGVSRSHLGNWMRGVAYPQHYPLYRFCRSTGVNTDYILLGDPSGLPKRIADVVLAAAAKQAELTGEALPQGES